MDKEQKKALQDLPGAAVDCADNEKTTEQRVKADVKNLNNNPRNTDGPRPGND